MHSIECCDRKAEFQTMHDGRDDLTSMTLALFGTG
jgi:hypothetical protein